MKIYGLVLGIWFFTGAILLAANPFESESAVTFAAPATLDEPLIEYKGEEWRGFYSGVKKPDELVFREAVSWEIFWNKMIQPMQKKDVLAPTIDFEKEMVVGVFRGEKPNPSYDIEIVRIIKKETALLVTYKYVDRLVGISSPRIAVQPFHLKKIAAFYGPVRFEKVKEK